MLSKGRGGCPECGMPVPVGKTVWGRGKPFACKACGTMIVASKIGWTSGGALAVGGIAASKALGPLSIVPILALIGAYDWATMRVERAA